MEQWWKKQQWRMIQTNFREIDFAGATPERFVADLQAFDANIVLLNAGGIIANYASKLEFEPENPFRDGKSVDPLIEACHKAGIRVLARTDFSKILARIYERHPDWAYRNKDGKIVDYNGFVQTCPNGGYQQTAVRQIIKEMLTDHAFDGIFYNMGGFRTRDYSYNYYGPCHCDACRRKFRERFGLDVDVPTEENEADPRYQKYRAFIRDCRDEHEESLAEYVKSIRPDVAIDGVDFQRIESNTELIRFRPQPPWQHSASSNTRCARDEERGIVSSNSSVDYIGFPYRHVAVSPELHELRLWQNVANLGGLDYFVISRLDNHRDTSGYENVKKVFRFAKEHAAEYNGLRSGAKTLLLRDEIWGEDAEIRGWIRALTEAHIPFDERLYPTLESAADAAKMLSRYDLVIVADIRFMSDKLAGVLDDFAARGGAVLATGEAGMHDDLYAPRGTSAMRCLGVEEILIRRKDALSAMFEIREQDRDMFPGFTTAPFVAVGERLVHLRMKPEAKGYLRYIPPHRYGPPEVCYFSDVTEEPGVFVHAHGKGRGILIPWLPGTFFYKEGHRNARMFLTDVLLRLCGAKSIAPDLTPMAETTLARGAKKTVVQLVNNSGHYANSYCAPLPIHNIVLAVDGAKPTGVRTLRGGKASFTTGADGMTRIALDTLNDFEAVILETL